MHRQWNDINLALRDSGMYGTYLLTLVAMNAWFGPWMSKAWFMEAVHKLEEVIAYSGADDPLFERLWPEMRRDLAGSTTTLTKSFPPNKIGMQEFLAWLPNQASIWRQGTKVL
eukprot:3660748-Amphidinium_carterae.1